MATVIISSLLKDMLVLIEVLAIIYLVEILQTIQGCSWCVLWTLPFFVIISSSCARLCLYIRSFSVSKDSLF